MKPFAEPLQLTSFADRQIQTVAENLQELRANFADPLAGLEIAKTSHQQRIQAFYHAALLHGLSVAMWRLPTETTDTTAVAPPINAIADFSGRTQPIALDFTQFEPGFLLSPFVAGDEHQALHIAAHAHLLEHGLYVADGAINHARRPPFLATYHSLLHHQGALLARWYAPQEKPTMPIASQSEYQRLVERTVAFIHNSGVRKVVTSRIVESLLPTQFDPAMLFQRLCQRYPHAFVSLVAIPGIGTWIGASPETLVRIDTAQVRTMALAGTQAKPVDWPKRDAQWGAKEIDEQAVVGADIRTFLRAAGIANVCEVGPQTVAAGKMVHLRTTFEVALPEAERLHLANQIVNTLHPTSAVCGMPKERALSFIQQHERHDRGFYSGFLGPVQIHGASALFVNLRCMQILQDRAYLYVGGGITTDSDPAAEWRETELKARTLLDVLHSE